MARTADYTIQGFLYQFNKTLLEVLKSPDKAVITVEGIIEDIDVAQGDVITAIQCKYHESVEKFQASKIYKPLLQMMDHFHFKSNGKVNYVLFAHFPGLPTETISVDKQMLEQTLETTNQDLNSYVVKLKGVVNLDNFLLKFSVNVGPAFDALVQEVCDLLAATGFSAQDVQTLFYPNAINMIANLSIQHDAAQRKITKNDFLIKLQQIKKTAISQWTLSLKNNQEILGSRRKQLKTNLSKNARTRYFLLHEDGLEDFDTLVVMFISDYLDKYHFKTAHTKTPIFCLNTAEDKFKEIQKRLYQKGIVSNDGLVADSFEEGRFFKEPMTQKADQGSIKREFNIRLLRLCTNGTMLNKRKGDDLFVLGKGGFDAIEIEDVNLEELATNSFNEIKYMIGISDVFE